MDLIQGLILMMKRKFEISIKAKFNAKLKVLKSIKSVGRISFQFTSHLKHWHNNTLLSPTIKYFNSILFLVNLFCSTDLVLIKIC